MWVWGTIPIEKIPMPGVMAFFRRPAFWPIPSLLTGCPSRNVSRAFLLLRLSATEVMFCVIALTRRSNL